MLRWCVVPRKMTDRHPFIHSSICVLSSAYHITIIQKQEKRWYETVIMGCVCLRLPVIISLFSTNHHLSTRTAASLWRIERYLFINPRKKQKEQPFLSKLRPQWNRYSHAFFVMGPRSILISKMMIIHQITFQSHHQPTSQPASHSPQSIGIARTICCWMLHHHHRRRLVTSGGGSFGIEGTRSNCLKSSALSKVQIAALIAWELGDGQ